MLVESASIKVGVIGIEGLTDAVMYPIGEYSLQPIEFLDLYLAL